MQTSPGGRMIDRRSFLTSSVALATAFTINPAESRATSSARSGSHPPRPMLALVDGQLAGSATFAAEARERGWLTFEFTRDAAGIWMRDLEPRLRSGPIEMAGYTDAATLFCVDLLARDYGARVMQRSERNRAVTWVIASSPDRRATLAPAAVRAQWRESHA